ncbi:copper-binding protein [Ewingella americana]|jgi:Cu(I)/Ag(I) efflux system protein CusF|uniref:Copper-binding protein n=2 Tax=Ewingella americana TaxID=41202 RepID=A0A502GUT5_9GAMM|nr:copper-binding protein [Ewingella americana]
MILISEGNIMSNIINIIALSVLFAAAAPVMAADTSMAGMQMADTPAKSDTANASGVVKKIDTAAGMVTLQHGPIPAINWPAMTMGFKVADPALLKNIKEGETVDFTLKAENGNEVVMAIQAKK